MNKMLQKLERKPQNCLFSDNKKLNKNISSRKNGTKQAFVFPETGKRKVTFHLQTATNHKEVEILGRNVNYIWGLTKALL